MAVAACRQDAAANLGAFMRISGEDGGERLLQFAELDAAGALAGWD
jgi:hypothetical protein